MIPGRGCCSTSCWRSTASTGRHQRREQIEFTHAAVAAYVASGMADVSFGVEAAARQFGLDFVRILTEDYFFVCKRAFLTPSRCSACSRSSAVRNFAPPSPPCPATCRRNWRVTGVKEFLEMHSVR